MSDTPRMPCGMYDCRHWQDGECWGSRRIWRGCELRYLRSRNAELTDACNHLVRMLVSIKKKLRREDTENRAMIREKKAKRWRRWG